MSSPSPRPTSGNGHPTRWRNRLHEVIFEADTPFGKLFDEVLIGAILISVAVVMIESIQEVRAAYGPWLTGLEWGFTIVFTIEYILRLISVNKPMKYATSFFGVIDLLAVIPTYLSLFIPGTQYLLVVRMLRVLRVFRVLKLVSYLTEARQLTRALQASRRKITVFVAAVLTLVVILGSLMYMVEGAQNGFTSIPRSIYWAIVTLTTVGYGDIAPQTDLGQALAAFVMIIGYAIIAVPTGIVTAELTRASAREKPNTQACLDCGYLGHDEDAVYCKRCGGPL